MESGATGVMQSVRLISLERIDGQFYAEIELTNWWLWKYRIKLLGGREGIVWRYKTGTQMTHWVERWLEDRVEGYRIAHGEYS